ncbi:MAG: acetylglutamate kinase [Bacteroidaceae bacterium]|nr:acetylglutamate kinase [Bacteroidaceae bacterium]
MVEKLNIIKVGGGVVEDAASLASLLEQFARLDGRKMLVHGGGRLATSMAASLGIESKMVGGRRITDEQMLRVVTMVYGGLVNKNIVAGLQAKGVRAIGLTGADGDIIRSHRRPLKRVKMDDGTEQMVDFGFVGDVDKVDAQLLVSLIEGGQVPVVAPLTHDGEGHILNTNADTIASSVAQALAEHYDVTLTFCFEKAGVLRDADDDSSVIPLITEEQAAELIREGIISGGMIPKIENAFLAIHRGVRQVVITHSENIDGTKGTIIKEK